MCDMAFGVIVSDARSTNRTSIASHLSISVFYDTSFVFGTHRSTYYFIAERLSLFVSSFHTFQRIGKYSHKLAYLSYFMHSLRRKKILSLI